MIEEPGGIREDGDEEGFSTDGGLETHEAIDSGRRELLKQIFAGVGVGILGLYGCSDKEKETEHFQPRPEPPRPEPPRPAPPQHIESVPEKPVFDVNIDRLRQSIIKNGVLVLTHNGIHEDGEVGYGEDEFLRIVQNEEGSNSLGKNVSVRKRVAKKTCSPKTIDEDGQLQDTKQSVTVYVVDGTQGVENAMTKKELQEIFRGKKFGLILVAGHVHDIAKLVELSKAVRADESYTLMGGCRTAEFIPNHFKPKHILAGAVPGIGTEAYTHFTRVTIGALLGRQFDSWEEYFSVMGRYSTFTYDHIMPGHPRYGYYVSGQRNSFQ